MALSLVACGGGKENNTDDVESYDIVVWVSESEGVADLTKEQLAAWCEANPDVKLTYTVEGVTEADSATKMIADVENGADIFCFAQDQLARLVQANALSPLGDKAAETVKAENDASSVAAATVGDKIYCYPLTSDNGYFMYYDKSVVAEDHLDDLAAIVADCEAAGRFFSMETNSSAWYVASFFFATGCTSEWTVDEEGKINGINDDFNSAKGLVAMEGMKILTSSAYHNSSSQAADFGAAIPSAVVVSGTWDYNNALGILGDNLGCTDLPSFTVDGTTYHMGSYSGNKLMGVKPQTDSKKAAVLQSIALYLTSEECQTQRFNKVAWGPSNKNAQNTDAVKANPGLAALQLQAEYARPQCQIDGTWWDNAKLLGNYGKEGYDNAQELLDAYTAYLAGLFAMSADEKEQWSLIGAFEDHNWDYDENFETADKLTWWTVRPIKFAAGNEVKVRQGASWDLNYGGDDAKDGANYAVAEDGYYFVVFTTNADYSEGHFELVKTSEKYGWSVIGVVDESNWDKDFFMEIQPDGTTWVLEGVNLDAGAELKVRYGSSWDVNYGKDGVAGGDNIVVDAAGTYTITFDSNTGLVTIA